ncbi:MAG: DsrE family protein [Gammaproteobacteria bacterium]|nr:DsrE family protein [Gammaproteobacteria bacterium]
MFKYRMKGTVALLFALLMLCSGVLFATSHSGGKHKLVIQVSSGDQQTQTIALNNAVNLQRELGPDNIAIEIVAYGPGLSLLTDKSTQKQRVESLAMQEITFSACGNTMKKVEKKSGKKPVLIEGVQVVPAGVLRIMQLQEQGYAYIRP